MQTLRPILTALLGLTLWVQGLAIAAAPVAVPDEPDAAMEMPCHGDAKTAHCDCCDSDCPDMASCAFGHLAGAPATNLQFSPAVQHVVAAMQRATAAGLPPSLLRPPIPSHA